MLIQIKKRMRITITIDVDGQGQVSINAGHETTEKQITETTEVKPTPVQAPKTEPETAAKPAPTAKSEPKSEPKPAAKPAAKPESKPAAKEPEPQPAAEEEQGVTLEDIREVAKEKINAHREAIKAKLAEYGASNISGLSPEFYEDFYVFLSCDLK